MTGLRLIDRDRPVHLLEHPAIADEDAVQASAHHHQRRRVRIAIAACKESDQTDFPATRERSNRSRQRPCRRRFR